MSPKPALLAAAALAVCATVATPAAAAKVDFQSLPESHITPVLEMRTGPFRVAKHERAKGFHVARMRGQSVIQILPTDELAKKARSGAYPTWNQETNGCYSQREVPVRKRPPAMSLTSRLIYYESDLEHLKGSVVPSHSERFVLETSGDARLDIADAWVDLRSLGSKLVNQYSVPLKLVATGPLGVKLYAARDGDQVHFVVRRPAPDPRFGNRGLSIQIDETFSGHSDCGHGRITLRADESGGETAKAALEMTFERDKNGKLKPLSPESPKEKTVAGKLVDAIGFGEKVAEPKERGVRTLNVHLSVSRSSADPHPVASSAFGWEGRARFMAF